ncbi:hypothetical protein ACH5RR_013315 [Cinchona calisaya]|uniref:Uncharacterized protein n=1 Tax=Cinchona calisaya TaxID=153742 RepID=A0ABD3A5E4_9GENT
MTKTSIAILIGKEKASTGLDPVRKFIPDWSVIMNDLAGFLQEQSLSWWNNVLKFLEFRFPSRTIVVMVECSNQKLAAKEALGWITGTVSYCNLLICWEVDQ